MAIRPTLMTQSWTPKTVAPDPKLNKSAPSKEGDKNFNLQRKKKQKIWILLGLLNPSIGPTYRISIAQSHCAQQIIIWPNFPPIGSDDLIIGFVTCKNICDKTLQNLRQQRGKGCDFSRSVGIDI